MTDWSNPKSDPIGDLLKMADALEEGPTPGLHIDVSTETLKKLGVTVKEAAEEARKCGAHLRVDGKPPSVQDLALPGDAY